LLMRSKTVDYISSVHAPARQFSVVRARGAARAGGRVGDVRAANQLG
jgi:hypothetical protein